MKKILLSLVIGACSGYVLARGVFIAQAKTTARECQEIIGTVLR